MARPQKEIDIRVFEGLCRIHCTLPEIAAVLTVSEDTVERWCKRTYKVGFAESHKKQSGMGKMSLRRAQFKAAEAGNATMLIWLGKQYLNQADKQEVESKVESVVYTLDQWKKEQAERRKQAVDALTVFEGANA